MWLFVLSVLIAVLAIVSTFTPIEYVTKYAFWVAIIAFIVLAFGNLVLNFINTVTYFPGANRRELSHFFLGGRHRTMPRKSPYTIKLTRKERVELMERSRQYTSIFRQVIRAKIVLLASKGLSNDAIAARLDTPRQIVSKWRQRFCIQRLSGLEEQPRGGRPARFSPQCDCRDQGTGL